jgi:hypothetical protein
MDLIFGTQCVNKQSAGCWQPSRVSSFQGKLLSGAKVCVCVDVPGGPLPLRGACDVVKVLDPTRGCSPLLPADTEGQTHTQEDRHSEQQTKEQVFPYALECFFFYPTRFNMPLFQPDSDQPSS